MAGADHVDLILGEGFLMGRLRCVPSRAVCLSWKERPVDALPEALVTCTGEHSTREDAVTQGLLAPRRG